MHVTLDQQTCQQTGYCVRVAPEVFVITGGQVTVLEPHPGPDLHDRVDEAERLCPTGAITVEF